MTIGEESPRAGPAPRASLAAVLIVRDEARAIVRCLDSVRPWVDRMIVVDTGSTDDTVAHARDCGAAVHHFAWRDDFSAARNHALAIADADWNLVIDADERIDAGGHLLREWCDGAARLGVVRIDSAYDVPGDDASVAANRSWITRLLPRGVRYERRVHEQAVSSLPRERLALHIAHDGYRDAQLARKPDRNRLLLLADLQDRPDDAYILFQLGRESSRRGDVSSACDEYARSLALTAPAAPWRHELVICLLQALGQANQTKDALALIEAEMPCWPQSPDFFFVAGEALLDQAIADPAGAIGRWLPLAVAAWERCLEIGERPDLTGSFAGRGSHLAQHNLAVVRTQLSTLSGSRAAG
ncbi:glycosyltransferase family 2 protein [Sphingomonas sp. SUN019]|uniref:glycosyltransferase n=1 Tax=Sphingomonas sp. SUN019 TaxID=2937788 RepID=UPI0021647A0B|nr:glycosyltransferase family 2 protein [Sphingomonas sp. SUN019]UVO51225.1 glycosyltransferase family 2 protein [Sphingomonas sp. SUN019]